MSNPQFMSTEEFSVRAVPYIFAAGPLYGQFGPFSCICANIIWLHTHRLVKRAVLLVAFLQAKQPSRIREVLELVYVNRGQIDDGGRLCVMPRKRSMRGVDAGCYCSTLGNQVVKHGKETTQHHK
jgi:hypothetical protein